MPNPLLTSFYRYAKILVRIKEFKTKGGREDERFLANNGGDRRVGNYFDCACSSLLYFQPSNDSIPSLAHINWLRIYYRSSNIPFNLWMSNTECLTSVNLKPRFGGKTVSGFLLKILIIFNTIPNFMLSLEIRDSCPMLNF